MTMLKPTELREKSPDELREEIKRLSEDLFKMRMKSASGQLDKPNLIGGIRRDLARVKTVLREKEMKIR